MSVVEELQDVVRSVSAKASPSVVAIGRHGRGSGFVVAPGRVVTNAHNLRDRTTQVRFADGRALQGTVVGSDVDGDLAVLEVDTGGAPALEWAAVGPEAGAIVVSVTAGGELSRATWGQVSAVDRRFHGPRGRPIAGAIEHTAAAAAGSSGAPLLDAAGAVVGISTHRLDHGFYLARPADEALRATIETLQSGQSVERTTLGVAIAPRHVAARLRRAVGLPERDGLLVRGVVEGSPAETAGIQQGDLLVRAGDRALTSADDLFEALASVAAGATLTVGLVRGAEDLELTVTFP